MRIIIFNSNKAILLGLLAFSLTALISVAMPFIFKGAAWTFPVAAITFFLIPFISFPFIKNKYTRECFLFLDDSGLELKNSTGEIITDIKWVEVSNYQIQPFKNLSDRGLMIKITCKDGKRLNLTIIGENPWNIPEMKQNNPGAFMIYQAIKKFNEQQSNADNFIELSPGFFASQAGSYLVWLPVVFLIIDLLYRSMHPVIAKENILFLLLSAFLVLMFWSQMVTDQKLFKNLKNLEEISDE